MKTVHKMQNNKQQKNLHQSFATFSIKKTVNITKQNANSIFYLGQTAKVNRTTKRARKHALIKHSCRGKPGQRETIKNFAKTKLPIKIF